MSIGMLVPILAVGIGAIVLYVVYKSVSGGDDSVE